MNWSLFQNGRTIGGLGSENGKLFLDEELEGKAKITIEECNNYFAITCWIYNWLVHTRFFKDKAEAEQECLKMKDELQDIVENVLLKGESREISIRCSDFVEKFP